MNRKRSLAETNDGKKLVVMLAAAILTTDGGGDSGGDGGDTGGDSGGDAGTGGDAGAGEQGGDGGTADELSALFTAEEIEARKTESARRAALTDEERAAEDQAKAEEAAKNSVPEEYADFTVPEGITLDTEMIDEFKPLAKEFKLNQEKAQKLVDLAVKVQQRTMDGIFLAHEERKATWLKEAQADPEIGEDCKKFDPANPESAKDSIAVRAYNTIAQGRPQLKAAVDELGIGNHPEFLRMFYRIGKAMREDTFELGGSGNPNNSIAGVTGSFFNHPSRKRG